MKWTAKNIALCAVLAALALGLSTLEGLFPISLLVPLPGVKLGLANIVTVFALYQLGAGAALVWPTFAVLCVAALLTGGATGAATIALQRHVGRAAHGGTQLRQVFSWLAIGPAVSNFVGPFCAGLLIDHAGAQAGATMGFRAAFALMAVLPLATWFLVRGTQEMPPVVAAEDGIVLLSIDKHVIMLSKLEEELKQIVSAVKF